MINPTTVKVHKYYEFDVVKVLSKSSGLVPLTDILLYMFEEQSEVIYVPGIHPSSLNNKHFN